VTKNFHTIYEYSARRGLLAHARLQSHDDSRPLASTRLPSRLD
jgi:hypothetical protein